jgi:hypothetical protein
VHLAIVPTEGTLGRLDVELVEVFLPLASKEGVEMAKGAEGGNKFDVMPCAMFVKAKDVFGREGIRSLPDVRMATIGVSMFDVELEMVDLVMGKFFGEIQEGLEFRNLAPGDIVVDATDGEDRLIGNLQAG